MQVSKVSNKIKTHFKDYCLCKLFILLDFFFSSELAILTEEYICILRKEGTLAPTDSGCLGFTAVYPFSCQTVE